MQNQDKFNINMDYFSKKLETIDKDSNKIEGIYAKALKKK